jgi:hypothetical protein
MALRSLGATDLPEAAWIACEDPAGISVEIGAGEKRVKLSMEFSEEKKVNGSRRPRVM